MTRCWVDLIILFPLWIACLYHNLNFFPRIATFSFKSVFSQNCEFVYIWTFLRDLHLHLSFLFFVSATELKKGKLGLFISPFRLLFHETISNILIYTISLYLTRLFFRLFLTKISLNCDNLIIVRKKLKIVRILFFTSWWQQAFIQYTTKTHEKKKSQHKILNIVFIYNLQTQEKCQHLFDCFCTV